MKLTRNDAEEIAYKLGVLADTPDLQEDYQLTQAQADELRDSVPFAGGEWNPPKWGLGAIKGEITDHCKVLRDGCAEAAFSHGDKAQGARICKQANRLESVVLPAVLAPGWDRIEGGVEK